MAGARSLQDDILALVKKHSDSCLPEDLLFRLAEEARLMGAKQRIRSAAAVRNECLVGAKARRLSCDLSSPNPAAGPLTLLQEVLYVCGSCAIAPLSRCGALLC